MTYPNGMIYVGMGLTGSITYFGSHAGKLPAVTRAEARQLGVRAGYWLNSRADNPGLNALFNLEPVTGIEPAFSAWEADVLPLNYIGVVLTKDSNPAPVVGQAGGYRLGESKKLTPACRTGDGRFPAKRADAAESTLPRADPEPGPARRNS